MVPFLKNGDRSYGEAISHVPFSNGETAISWSTLVVNPPVAVGAPISPNDLRALDPKLIGDMQELFGRERDPQDTLDWYKRVIADSNADAGEELHHDKV